MGLINRTWRSRVPGSKYDHLVTHTPKVFIDPDDDLIEAYRAVDPMSFTEPVSIKQFYRSIDHPDFRRLVVEIEYLNKESNQILRVWFYAVSKFNMHDDSSLFPPWIENVEGAQWYEMHYFVSSEHGEYHFYCDDFCFTVLPA